MFECRAMLMFALGASYVAIRRRRRCALMTRNAPPARYASRTIRSMSFRCAAAAYGRDAGTTRTHDD